MKRALYVVRRSRIELDFLGCHQPAAYVPPWKEVKPGGKAVRRMFIHLHDTTKRTDKTDKFSILLDKPVNHFSHAVCCVVPSHFVSHIPPGEAINKTQGDCLPY